MLEGTLKYGRHNYREAGVRASVYVDAAMGHIQQFVEGEDIDKDSGLSHITKAICSLFVLRDAQMNGLWTDDRPPKIKDMDAVRDHLTELVSENFKRYADKDPHHYSELEDGAPYNDAEMSVYAEVVSRFKQSAQFSEMVVEEQSRRDLRSKQEAESNCKMSTAAAHEQELDAILATIAANGGNFTVNGVGELNAEFGVSPAQLIANMSRFSNEPPQEDTSFGSLRGPSLESCAAHLEDPLYWPRDPLACLSDDDPVEIIWVSVMHPEYGRGHVVEGLTMKQFQLLVNAEAVFCGRGNFEFEPLARRVLLRLKSQPEREVTLTFPGEGVSDRKTRLTNRQWETACPGVSVKEKPYHGLLRPATTAGESKGGSGGISPTGGFVPRGFA